MKTDYKAQHENLILQVVLNAVKDEGAEYLDTDAGQEWLGLLGISTNIAKEALEATAGAVKDIRYINEHLDA
jgi:hypothetical protein|tara:strand:- start:945 stop:1160 length:216 start_codon:yes stop_codon:yes gene_type:complete